MEGKRLVIVEWLDHTEGKDWVEIDKVDPDPLHCFTVGWVIAETDDVMVVAPNYSVEKGQARMVTGEMQILKKVIVIVQGIKGLTGRKRKR